MTDDHVLVKIPRKSTQSCRKDHPMGTCVKKRELSWFYAGFVEVMLLSLRNPYETTLIWLVVRFFLAPVLCLGGTSCDALVC